MTLLPAPFIYKDSNWIDLSSTKLIVKNTDPKELGSGGRIFQPECYKNFHNKRRTLNISPTGSGKSLVQVFLAGREILESNYKQKQCFIVPQLNIGNGFTQYKHESLKFNNKIYGWEVTTNCCLDNNQNNQSVNEIKKFLLKSHPCNPYRANKILGGCTAVVSSRALLIAFNRMSIEEKHIAIKNTSFRFDEIHHMCGIDESGEFANQLGKLCKFLLDNNGSVHLTTATYFRGNNHSILSNDYLNQFEIFRVPFMEHWKTLNLKSLHQSYHCYTNANDLLNQILVAIKQEPNEPSLIIVPADNQKYFRQTEKFIWVKKLVVSLGEIVGHKNVLDLVSKDRQSQDKKRLTADIQDFKIIVTCGIGKEGSDWPPCSRIHNTILDNNVLQPIQKLGRGLRLSDGKIDVKMFNYIEHFPEWDADAETIRQKLSDRFNAILLASMWDDMFFPIEMPTLPSKKNPVSKNVSLEDIYGSKRNELIENMMKRVLEISAKHLDGEIVDEIIVELISKYKEDMLEDVDKDILKQRLRKEIFRRCNPSIPNLKIDGIVVDFIRENGWDKVVRKHIANHSPFCGEATTKDLEKLQEFLIDKKWLDKLSQLKKVDLEVGIENIDIKHPLYKFACRLFAARSCIKNKAKKIQC